MIYLVTLQKEKLLFDAREALEKEKQRGQSLHAELKRPGRDPKLQQDIKNLLESLKEPAVTGTNGKEYEYEEGDLVLPETGDIGAAVDFDGDAVMGGMDHSISRNVSIHYELSSRLHELVLKATSEIEAYDRHAETTKDYYRRALQRHAAREGTSIDSSIIPVPAAQPPTAPARERKAGGILKNTNDEIRINMEALARMSKEDQSFSPNQQSQSAIDITRDPRRKQVDFSRDPRRNSVDFARDTKTSSVDVNKDVWRR